MGTHGPGAAAEAPLRLTETGRRRSELYGRRTGRPLSVQQQALFETLLPKIAVPDGRDRSSRAVSGRAGVRVRSRVRRRGASCRASARPSRQRAISAASRIVNGVAKLLTQIDDGALANVRIHPEDAREVLARLPDASLSAALCLVSRSVAEAAPSQAPVHSERRASDELARAMLKSGGEFSVGDRSHGLCALGACAFDEPIPVPLGGGACVGLARAAGRLAADAL